MFANEMFKDKSWNKICNLLKLFDFENIHAVQINALESVAKAWHSHSSKDLTADVAPRRCQSEEKKKQNMSTPF